jgi:hypothetical protein
MLLRVAFEYLAASAAVLAVQPVAARAREGKTVPEGSRSSGQLPFCRYWDAKSGLAAHKGMKVNFRVHL